VTAAERAVEAIVRDLYGRQGLGDEWAATDEEIQDEIKQTWAGLIANAFGIAGATP